MTAAEYAKLPKPSDCPICGSKTRLESSLVQLEGTVTTWQKQYYVVCDKDACGFYGPNWVPRAESIRVWNRIVKALRPIFAKERAAAIKARKAN
jgi:hypothetical protein